MKRFIRALIVGYRYLVLKPQCQLRSIFYWHEKLHDTCKNPKHCFWCFIEEL